MTWKSTLLIVGALGSIRAECSSQAAADAPLADSTVIVAQGTGNGSEVEVDLSGYEEVTVIAAPCAPLLSVRIAGTILTPPWVASPSGQVLTYDTHLADVTVEGLEPGCEGRVLGQLAG